MSISSGLYTSRTEEWATPQEFFDELNREFNFTLDPCSTDENHKCEQFYTIFQNGLLQDWGGRMSLLILLMVERSRNGLRNVTKKVKSQTLKLFC